MVAAAGIGRVEVAPRTGASFLSRELKSCNRAVASCSSFPPVPFLLKRSTVDAFVRGVLSYGKVEGGGVKCSS